MAGSGTEIEWVAADHSIELPPGERSFVLTRMDDGGWASGRAGMRYRDLIPGRQGGRFIASHIHIPGDGPVPDYVHYHKIRFQMIYCWKGWARLVYEDQGAPFLFSGGDCVLQPPEIRHRVLESGDELEVVEITSPAEHPTCADHDMDLPNATVDRDRRFGRQRFVHHRGGNAEWVPWRRDGFEVRDFGFEAATDGLARAGVLRTVSPAQGAMTSHDDEFLFLYVLTGSLVLDREDHAPDTLHPGDCCVIPAGLEHALTPGSEDLQFLEAKIPPNSD